MLYWCGLCQNHGVKMVLDGFYWSQAKHNHLHEQRAITNSGHFYAKGTGSNPVSAALLVVGFALGVADLWQIPATRHTATLLTLVIYRLLFAA